jgi:hypothetical protein
MLNETQNTNQTLASTSEPDDAVRDMEREFMKERIRQARLSFNLTLVLTAVSAAISVMGVGLLFAGKVPEGSVTTAGGLSSNLVSVRLLRLTKETNDRLDKMAHERQ